MDFLKDGFVLLAKEEVDVVLSQKLYLGMGLLLGEVFELLLIPAGDFFANGDLVCINICC